jgi:cell division protein FtsW
LQQRSKDSHQAFERSVLIATFLLLIVGLTHVLSTTYLPSLEVSGDGFLLFKRQLLFAGAGLVLLFLFYKLPMRAINIGFVAIWVLSFLGVVLTLIPGIGVTVGGAHRWLQITSGLRIQPSEFLKISLPFALALALVFWKVKSISVQVLALIFLVGPIGILLLQPDFGSFALCLLVVGFVIFALGLPLKFLTGAAVLAVPLFYFIVMAVPYRRARFTAFLDPWGDPQASGFQIIQSLLSFKSGGLFGAGPGQSQGKMFFLPEAHTDFALSIFVEEWGYVGFLALMSVMLFLVFKAFQVSLRAKSEFRQVVAFGIAILLSLNILISAGVVMGLVPTKGLATPFLSYGGSHLIATLISVGVLLNLYRFDHQSSRGAK